MCEDPEVAPDHFVSGNDPGDENDSILVHSARSRESWPDDELDDAPWIVRGSE